MSHLFANYLRLSIVLAITTLHSWSYAEVLKFSAFEQKIWTLVSDKTVTEQQVYSELQGLNLQLSNMQPNEQALFLMHECRIAIRATQQPNSQILKKLQNLNRYEIYKYDSAALIKCKQYQEYLNSESDKIFLLEYEAFYKLNESDTPLLKMWLAYDFANLAMDAGYTDEAINAIGLSIKIAEANNLQEWVSESLGILALLQSDIKQSSIALLTINRAIELSRNTDNIKILQLRLGFILKEANQLNDALAVYNNIIEKENDYYTDAYITAALNISAIYQSIGKNNENLKLTEKLLTIIVPEKDPYSWHQANILRAFALLTAGQYDAANKLFSQAQVWFERNHWLVYLVPKIEEWAKLLEQSNLYKPAYYALTDASNLKHRLNIQKRQRDALLNNARLESEQHKRALLELSEEHKKANILLEKQQNEHNLIITIVIITVTMALFILIVYLRLRNAHRLLAVKSHQLDYESKHDPLTKVYNRRYFEQFIRTKYNDDNIDALFLLIDIDHFKNVNDTYGHQIGDLVLEIVSKRITNRVKNNDKVIRWGGEEFLVYIENPDNKVNCIKLIERLLNEIYHTPVELKDHQLYVTISIGFGVYQMINQTQIDHVLNQIDEYLYKAKTQGRNQAVGNLGRLEINDESFITLKTSNATS